MINTDQIDRINGQFDCPGGWMGRPPGEHFWSIPNPTTGERTCLWCNAKWTPITITAKPSTAAAN